MKTRPQASWLVAPAAALALLASPASAGVITFESATAGTLLQPTDTYVEQGFRLAQDTVNFFPGFGLIDSSAAYYDAPSNPAAPVAPTGNGTQFLGLLNDAALTLERADGLAFTLTGFSFGAVAPVGDVFSGLDFGSLIVLFETETGATGQEAFDFGVGDASGAYGFQSVSGGGLGALGGGMLRLTFLACTYDGSGGCNYSDPVNWSQFALDDIAFVPEPGSFALAGLGLLAAGLARRQTRRTA
jgi:hypothetical protein